MGGAGRKLERQTSWLFTSPNTIMRLQYLESEKGGQLRIDSTTPGFSGVRAIEMDLRSDRPRLNDVSPKIRYM